MAIYRHLNEVLFTVECYNCLEDQRVEETHCRQLHAHRVEIRAKCLRCGHEWVGKYDPQEPTEPYDVEIIKQGADVTVTSNAVLAVRERQKLQEWNEQFK